MVTGRKLLKSGEAIEPREPQSHQLPARPHPPGPSKSHTGRTGPTLCPAHLGPRSTSPHPIAPCPRMQLEPSTRPDSSAPPGVTGHWSRPPSCSCLVPWKEGRGGRKDREGGGREDREGWEPQHTTQHIVGAQYLSLPHPVSPSHFAPRKPNPFLQLFQVLSCPVLTTS